MGASEVFCRGLLRVTATVRRHSKEIWSGATHHSEPMDRRPWAMVIAFMAVLASMFTVAIALPSSPPSNQPTIIRGVGAASDGRLSINIDSWLMANNNYTEFPGDGYPSTEYFLVLDLTLANVGHGNASIPGIMFATVSEGGRDVSNTWFWAPSNRASELPSGDNLFPGSSMTGWWAFFVPGGTSSSSFVVLNYTETEYGGAYLGNASYGSPIPALLDVVFEIEP